MVEMKADDLRFCYDCMYVAVNGQFLPDTPDDKIDRIKSGLESFDGHIANNHNSETKEGIWNFSNVKCDCCGTRQAGKRYRFSLFG